MKKIAVLVIVLTFSLNLFSQTYGWKPKPSGVKSGTFYDVKFWNKDTGIVVGNNDTVNYILVTTDGGETWTNKVSAVTSDKVKACEFIDGKTIYVVGKKGACYKTTNLGDSWTKINLGTNADFNDISFPSKTRGYVCSNSGGYIFYDGIGWQAKLVYSMDNFIRVKFPVDTAGILTAQSGRVWRSIDGGKTWDTIKRTTEPVYNSYFITANVGYIVGPKGKVKRTVNGGINWTDTQIYAKNFKNIDFYSAYFVGQNIGFIGGTNGTILRTVDGGSNWTQEWTNPVTETIMKIYFVNPVIGFAVGTNGIILKRQDVSGITETQSSDFLIYPNPANDFIKISSEHHPCSFVIKDITGKEIIKNENAENTEFIEISALSPGVYFLTLSTEGKIITSKFIKQ